MAARLARRLARMLRRGIRLRPRAMPAPAPLASSAREAKDDQNHVSPAVPAKARAPRQRRRPASACRPAGQPGRSASDSQSRRLHRIDQTPLPRPRAAGVARFHPNRRPGPAGAAHLR
jgi:hypothetical protein